MENRSCSSCNFIDQEAWGLFCPVLDKKISVVNLKFRDPLCNDKKLEKYSRKFALAKIARQKLGRLKSIEQVYIALGEVHDWAYHERRRNEKRFRGKYTVWMRPDGSYKSKEEMSEELKMLYRAAIRKAHPDSNPSSEQAYYTAETKPLIVANDRGKEIIERHFKQW